MRPAASASPGFMACHGRDTRAGRAGAAPRRIRPKSGDWFNNQLEKRLADNDFVAVLEFHRTARLQTRLAIHIGPVEAADILDRELAAVDSEQRVFARNLG